MILRKTLQSNLTHRIKCLQS